MKRLRISVWMRTCLSLRGIEVSQLARSSTHIGHLCVGGCGVGVDGAFGGRARVALGWWRSLNDAVGHSAAPAQTITAQVPEVATSRFSIQAHFQRNLTFADSLLKTFSRSPFAFLSPSRKNVCCHDVCRSSPSTTADTSSTRSSHLPESSTSPQECAVKTTAMAVVLGLI